MLNAGQIAEILALYRRHGWILRRVLLTDALRERLGDEAERLFVEVETRRSDLDAAWFARPPKNGDETWELRRLSDAPFALTEFFEADDAPEIREEAFREVEARLRGAGRP